MYLGNVGFGTPWAGSVSYVKIWNEPVTWTEASTWDTVNFGENFIFNY